MPSFTASAYSPSVGRNITAKAVVFGGSIYFWFMSRAIALRLCTSSALADFMRSRSALSYASMTREYTSMGNFESMGISTPSPSSEGSFTANSTFVPRFMGASRIYWSGESISSSMEPNWISPSIPRVLTFERTFFRSPTPVASVCISPSPL